MEEFLIVTEHRRVPLNCSGRWQLDYRLFQRLVVKMLLLLLLRLLLLLLMAVFR